jgi:hypothetical protein
VCALTTGVTLSRKDLRLEWVPAAPATVAALASSRVLAPEPELAISLYPCLWSSFCICRLQRGVEGLKLRRPNGDVVFFRGEGAFLRMSSMFSKRIVLSPHSNDVLALNYLPTLCPLPIGFLGFGQCQLASWRYC